MLFFELTCVQVCMGIRVSCLSSVRPAQAPGLKEKTRSVSWPDVVQGD